MFCFRKKVFTYKQKANETKEVNRIFIENLTGYNDVVCKFEFALCTFNFVIES